MFIHGYKTCICEQPTADGDACDICKFCQQLPKKSYSHLFEITPASKSRQILVDEIRELEHFLSLTTAGEIKLGLIMDADRMSTQAQNAFLKTLEEPVSKIIIILVTQNPEALLPTIRSRCQMVSLRSNRYQLSFPGDEDLFKVLASMRKGKGAMVASSASEQIMGILMNLRKNIESLIKKEKSAEISSNSLEIKRLKKREEADIQVQAAAHYLSVRSQVISAIHSWFGQEFLRASGIPIEMLSHPNFYNGFSDNFKNIPANTQESLWALQISESLVENFTLNVNEQLAVQEFCYRLCTKGSGSTS